jgi:DNA uptake protein ComE-like DNA-binding protein
MIRKAVVGCLSLLVAGALALSAPQGKSGAAGAKPAASAPASAAAEPIDINSAPKEKLMTIRGIGDAYSAAIIKNRPYKRKDELVSKKALPQAVYDKIKDQIIAKQK